MPDFTVSIAELNTRITFQSPTITQGTDGAQVSAWANIASVPTVWSKWVHDHGQELAQSESGRSVERATITVRYRSDIKPSYAILDAAGSRWQIISAPENVQNQNRWTVFRVERVKGSL
ncbi:MAG: head-tail adaptor protein [Chloroflexi bacterium]|nr:head-tail adaptor protein [Chloroflexota bacterium]